MNKTFKKETIKAFLVFLSEKSRYGSVRQTCKPYRTEQRSCVTYHSDCSCIRLPVFFFCFVFLKEEKKLLTQMLQKCKDLQ